MKRIPRDRRLAPEEAAKYKAVRRQVEGELPDLIARHDERMASLSPDHEVSASEFGAELQQRIDASRSGKLSSSSIDETRDVVEKRLSQEREA